MMLNMMFGSNITTDTIRENNSVLKKAFDKNISESEFDDAVCELSENLKIDKEIKSGRKIKRNKMNIKKALQIVKEFQKYRRGEKPYDGETPETYKRFDYSGKPLGEALDSIIKFVDVTISAQEMFAKMGTELNFCGVVNKKNSNAKAGK